MFEIEAQTHPKQSTLPVNVNTSTHRSGIFQQVRKVQLLKFNPTDKIPAHEHLYSDQYCHINSITTLTLKNNELKSQVSYKIGT